jgi:cation:H+ antiporter
VTLGISVRGASALFVLFAVQFTSSLTLPTETERVVALAISGVYVVLALALFVRHRHELLRTSQDGLVTPYEELEEADRVAK